VSLKTSSTLLKPVESVSRPISLRFPGATATLERIAHGLDSHDVDAGAYSERSAVRTCRRGHKPLPCEVRVRAFAILLGRRPTMRADSQPFDLNATVHDKPNVDIVYASTETAGNCRRRSAAFPV